MSSSSQMLIKILSIVLVFNILCGYVLKTNAKTNANDLFPVCSGGDITSNAYRSNVNLLLSSLRDSFSKTIHNNYYNNTIGEEPNTAYGSYQCRGDVTLKECRNSVNLATKEVLHSCPNSKEARIAFKDVLSLKFSNQSFFSLMLDNRSITVPDGYPVTNRDEFDLEFKKLMNVLLAKVASNGNNSSSSFATNKNLHAIESVDVSPKQKIYAQAQCNSDLSVEDCIQCLSTQINKSTEQFSGWNGGKVYSWNCYMRYATFPFYLPPKKSRISLKVFLVIAVPSLITVLSIIILLYCYTKRRKKVLERKNEYINEIRNAESLQFKFSTISAATHNFSDTNKLGQGGFGIVYKGRLSDGQEIAVKRLSEHSWQGEEEFKNEVVLLVKLQHRNLVRLLGFCLDGEEKLLVYEFMKHGSLDQFLFDPIKRTYLNWERRYNIIGGIAKGLLYLHEDSRHNIIHRDLKASNVLLGEDMVPKISDFGMARIFKVNQNEDSTKRICGTLGYMAPEYATHGKFSVKSDVYSFGVLILEILCAKRINSFGGGAGTVLSYAWRMWKEGKSIELLDPTLRQCSSTNEVMRCIQIGLLCAQEDVSNRPTMPWIIHMLNNHSDIIPSPESPLSPSTFLLHGESETSIPSEYAYNISANDQVSMSDLYPR